MSERPLVQSEQVGSSTILGFGGLLKSINEDLIPAIADELLGAEALSGTSDVVVDLDGVEFFGSSFIEVLFRLWNRVKSHGGRFALCGLAPYCVEILSVTNLDRLWSIYGSREEALAGIAQQQPD